MKNQTKAQLTEKLAEAGMPDPRVKMSPTRLSHELVLARRAHTFRDRKKEADRKACRTPVRYDG